MHFIFHEGLDVEQGQLHVRFFLNPFQIKIGQIDPISNLRGFDLANMSKNSKNITGHTQTITNNFHEDKFFQKSTQKATQK